jgi:carbonic anhydrase/acetyltransferase-like protein (isoleucine patch superfamily)
MSETFKHLFGGWRGAEARRWKNPDGSEGGIVAMSAHVHPSVVLPTTVEIWPEAKIAEGVRSIGGRASIGYGASIGGRASIGYGASIGGRASIGYGASIGGRASIGYGASIGDGSVYEDGDWLFVAGPQGSRNAYVTAVDSPKHGLRWWVGCQEGITTERLRERVEREHGMSEFGDDYRSLIDFVERHPGRMRAIAERAANPATEDAATQEPEAA